MVCSSPKARANKKGKTPVLDEEYARMLLEACDAESVVGLRDRALIALQGPATAAVLARALDEYQPEFISAHFGYPTAIWLAGLEPVPPFVITCQ